MLEEGGLQRRQLAIGEAFDGADAAARNTRRRNEAGTDRFIVEHDGAGAAIAGIAADFRPGEM